MNKNNLCFCEKEVLQSPKESSLHRSLVDLNRVLPSKSEEKNVSERKLLQEEVFTATANRFDASLRYCSKLFQEFSNERVPRSCCLRPYPQRLDRV